MNYWCKARIVVGWQRIERAILLRLVIYLRIVTAKEPENRPERATPPQSIRSPRSPSKVSFALRSRQGSFGETRQLPFLSHPHRLLPMNSGPVE